MVFNEIWKKMERNKVKWLIRFIEAWYDDSGITYNTKKQLEENPQQDPSIGNTKNKKVELDNSKLFRVIAEKWFMSKKDSHASTTYNRNLGAIRKHIFPMLGDK